MLLNETSKSEMSDYLPLTVTVENPNTGGKVSIQTRFFLGAYLLQMEDDRSVGIGDIQEGKSDAMELAAVIRTLEEKTIPEMKKMVKERLKEVMEELGKPVEEVESLLDTCFALLFSDGVLIPVDEEDTL